MAKVPVFTPEISPTNARSPVAVAIGFSARSLAQALKYSGFRVVTVDAFGDCDTIENSLLVQRLPNWGSIHAELLIQPHLWLEQIGADLDNRRNLRIPVLFGGGCENWTKLPSHLFENPLLDVLGPDPRQLGRLRSLELWQRAAEYAGMRFPRTVAENAFAHTHPLGSEDSDSQPERWLTKSLSSAGGLSVARTSALSLKDRALLANPKGAGDRSSFDGEYRQADSYLQEEVGGRVLGAVLVARWELPSPQSTGQPTIAYLGATESWQAQDWHGPAEFIYRGSWGPIELTEDQENQLVHAARFLACETGVRGWLQIDFIEDSGGQLWFLEVNPRWSAGMEILLRSGRGNPVVEHLKAWGHGDEGNPNMHRTNSIGTSPLDHRQPLTSTCHPSRTAGKAIVYCQRDILADAEFIAKLQRLPRDHYADIPSSECIGQCLKAGQPLLTVMDCFEGSSSDLFSRTRVLEKLRGLAGPIDP